jgi:hypothetical protein
MGCTVLQSRKLYDLYSTSTIIWMIKSRMRWVGHVACMGDMRGTYTVLVGKVEGIDCLEDLGEDGMTAVKWIFKKWDGEP